MKPKHSIKHRPKQNQKTPTRKNPAAQQSIKEGKIPIKFDDFPFELEEREK